MNFPERAPVTPAKKDALKERIARLEIDLSAVAEKFIRAGGPDDQVGIIRVHFPDLSQRATLMSRAEKYFEVKPGKNGVTLRG